MKTDFREERKWKEAGAKYLAEACTLVGQFFLQQTANRFRSKSKTMSLTLQRHRLSTAAPTPDLIPSAENDDDTEAIDEASFRQYPMGTRLQQYFLSLLICLSSGLYRSSVADKISA